MFSRFWSLKGWDWEEAGEFIKKGKFGTKPFFR